MKILIKSIFLVSLITINPSLSEVSAQELQKSRCTVRGSVGSPLNVRSTPGGKRIVSRLKNGTRVFVRHYSGDAKDQAWAEVMLSGKRNARPVGWVLGDFLDCDD